MIFLSSLFRWFACLLLAVSVHLIAASAQEGAAPAIPTAKPSIEAFAPILLENTLATASSGRVTLEAKLSESSEEISRGLIWRVFKPELEQGGKMPIVATANGGTQSFELPSGSYLVHAAFGRAGATKRITVGGDPKTESLVLDAGGLILDAVLPGGLPLAPGKLRFSIYESVEDEDGERALIVPNVRPHRVIRLNSGTYHVVSTYGDVNATIRSDIRVEAGKLTEAQVEHRAAPITLKLVREKNGEAIADTSWAVLTESGDIVREAVGAYASMILSEGAYTVIATNRGRVFQREVTIAAGPKQDIELLVTQE